MSLSTPPEKTNLFINNPISYGNMLSLIPTAVPAFVGYTPQASYQGKSLHNKPFKISSFADFQAAFCYASTPSTIDPQQQYSPTYYLVAQEKQPQPGNFVQVEDTYYNLVPDPNTMYYFYNSIKLFFENGGSDAFIVSVGSYGLPSKSPPKQGGQLVNPNVVLSDLLNGLKLLLNEREPTMYICPEATLLTNADNAALMQAMLQQCSGLTYPICIFDIIESNYSSSRNHLEAIKTFRNSIGTADLNYGAAYYPFIDTNITQASAVNYTNLFGGDCKQLKAILSPPSKPNTKAETILANIVNPKSTPLTISQNNNALMAASQTYSRIIKLIVNQINLLPPSAGMAGIIAKTDVNFGPWKAPKNTALIGVNSVPTILTNEQQKTVSTDAISGKSINVLRFFKGEGILVKSAKTLDGNSIKWKQLAVRRTANLLKETCYQALSVYEFHPNNQHTWTALVTMLEQFLHNIWQQNGLVGLTPSEAFGVACGLDTTMTSKDIQNGILKVTIKVALQQPSEFTVFNLQKE